MRVGILYSLLFLLPVMASASSQQGGSDVSQSFASYYAQEDDKSFIANLPTQFDEKIQQYFFLIVPGVLSDYMDYTIGELNLETENKFMNFLSAHGLQEKTDFQKISLKTGYSGEAGPEANSDAIIAAIQAAKKPILLFTHSKGSVDTLVTLVQHPELRKKIAGWVASQSPFHGSPTADQVCEHPLKGLPAEILFELFAGNQLGLQSLQQESRDQFMADNAAEIEKITSLIPTISFASYVQEKDLSGWMLVINALYGQQMESLYHNEHDGLVPIESTSLPGADFAIFEGLTHLSDNRREKPYTALSLVLLDRLSSQQKH
jgi:hypothetical protein